MRKNENLTIKYGELRKEEFKEYDVKLLPKDKDYGKILKQNQGNSARQITKFVDGVKYGDDSDKDAKLFLGNTKKIPILGHYSLNSVSNELLPRFENGRKHAVLLCFYTHIFSEGLPMMVISDHRMFIPANIGMLRGILYGTDKSNNKIPVNSLEVVSRNRDNLIEPFSALQVAINDYFNRLNHVKSFETISDDQLLYNDDISQEMFNTFFSWNNENITKLKSFTTIPQIESNNSSKSCCSNHSSSGKKVGINPGVNSAKRLSNTTIADGGTGDYIEYKSNTDYADDVIDLTDDLDKSNTGSGLAKDKLIDKSNTGLGSIDKNNKNGSGLESLSRYKPLSQSNITLSVARSTGSPTLLYKAISDISTTTNISTKDLSINQQSITTTSKNDLPINQKSSETSITTTTSKIDLPINQKSSETSVTTTD
jgi:hypothetical protein